MVAAAAPVNSAPRKGSYEARRCSPDRRNASFEASAVILRCEPDEVG